MKTFRKGSRIMGAVALVAAVAVSLLAIGAGDATYETFYFDSGGSTPTLGLSSNAQINFTATTGSGLGTKDAGIVRRAAGIVGISDGLSSNANGYLAAAKIGPNTTQQHTLPAVASDTVALLAAAQAISGKTTISASTQTATVHVITPTVGPSSTQQHTLPAVTSDTVALIAASQTLTNKTITAQKITANVTISGGTGSPEGAVTAPIGSLYLRSDGATNTALYIKCAGTGNTGWIAQNNP